MNTKEEIINIADAKRRFSEIVGQVAYGNKRILITKRGKPMARLISAVNTRPHLAEARGWLDEDDPFFELIDTIIESRQKHTPRVFKDH